MFTLFSILECESSESSSQYQSALLALHASFTFDFWKCLPCNASWSSELATQSPIGKNVKLIFENVFRRLNSRLSTFFSSSVRVTFDFWECYFWLLRMLLLTFENVYLAALHGVLNWCTATTRRMRTHCRLRVLSKRTKKKKKNKIVQSGVVLLVISWCTATTRRICTRCRLGVLSAPAKKNKETQNIESSFAVL